MLELKGSDGFSLLLGMLMDRDASEYILHGLRGVREPQEAEFS